MKLERWELPALAVLMAIATAARLIGLNASLWYDEVLTLTRFVRLPWTALVQDFSSFNNHMFYSLQAKAAVAMFGETAAALRAPAVVMGLASLPLIWKMARDAAGPLVAILTLGLLALSYHHVWFSQNARGYTGLLVWTTAATLLFVRGLKTPDWRTFTLFGLCLAAGMYTHLTAALFFLAPGLVFASLAAVGVARPNSELMHAFPGARDARAYYGFALGAVLTLALHAPLIEQVLGAVSRMGASSGGSTMAEWNNPLRALREFAGALDGLGPLAPLALVGGLAAIVVGLVGLFRRAPMLTTVFALQIPTTLAILITLSFRIWPRYFFVDIGFVFLCAAMGAVLMARWFGQRLERLGSLGRFAPIAGVGLVAVGGSSILLAPNYAHPKQDFEGAIALIENARAPGDISTSTGLAAEPMRAYYRPTWPVVETASDLSRLSGSGRVWLITAFQDHTRKTRPDVMAMVDSEFEEIAELPGTMGGGYMHIYRSKSPSPTESLRSDKDQGIKPAATLSDPAN